MLHEKQSSGNCQKETIHGVLSWFRKKKKKQTYIPLFSCTCARVHFSLVIVQLLKNWFNDKFFLRRVFCSNLKRTFRFEFFCFFRKMHVLCDTNLQWRIIQLILGMRKTSREAADPRVIRRHQIGWPNAMASVASDEAFLLMECVKNALSRGVLKRNCKLTWKHLWPRVYSVFNETLPYRPRFYTKKGEILICMTRSSWLW